MVQARDRVLGLLLAAEAEEEPLELREEAEAAAAEVLRGEQEEQVFRQLEKAVEEVVHLVRWPWGTEEAAVVVYLVSRALEAEAVGEVAVDVLRKSEISKMLVAAGEAEEVGSMVGRVTRWSKIRKAVRAMVAGEEVAEGEKGRMEVRRWIKAEEVVAE